MIKELYRKIRWNFIYDYWPKGNYGGLKNCTTKEGKRILADKIESGESFALARIGFGEVDFLYELLKKDYAKCR